jgi:hypothetical protein
MKKMAVSEFKAHALKVLDEVASPPHSPDSLSLNSTSKAFP